MSDIAALNEQEKIFLAGAIKTLILADGEVGEAELDDLDRIVDELEFDDFDEHLERFEATVKSEDDLEYLARNMFHEPSKKLITRVLWDLALQQGFASPAEEKVIRNIQAWWKL